MVVVSSVSARSAQCKAQRAVEIVSRGNVSAVLNTSLDERGTTRTTLLQGLQLLAGLKAHRFAGRDGNLGAGARIAADAGLARAHVEDAEAAQLNALAV